jgi:hypothetical protein
MIFSLSYVIFLSRRNRYKKYGTPITAVIIPAGISIGGNNPLPMLSATSRKMEPKRAEAGSKTLNFDPTTLLAIWGAIKPMNPIEPTAATQTPINMTETLNNI